MLGKLIKQEWKANVRILIPLYSILVCTTLITSLLASLDNKFSSPITILSIFPYVISIVLITAGTTILLYVRFYKNLLTDEGYLMFTLPVKTEELVLSKLIIACILSIGSIAAVFLSTISVACASGHYKTIKESAVIIWEELIVDSGINAPLLILEFALILILSVASSIIIVYLSIALGQLFTGHRIIGAFVSYGGIYIVIQIFSLIVMMLFFLVNGYDYMDVEQIGGNVLALYMLPLFLLLNVAGYLGTVYIMKKKLNLE